MCPLPLMTSPVSQVLVVSGTHSVPVVFCVPLLDFGTLFDLLSAFFYTHYDTNPFGVVLQRALRRKEKESFSESHIFLN